MASQLKEYKHKISQKLITSTLFARTKESTLPENDIFILYCMENGRKINVGNFFSNDILKLATKSNIKIMIRSFITKIAKYLITNFSTNSLTHVHDPEVIELYNLGTFGVCKRVGEVYYLEHIAKAMLDEYEKKAEKRKKGTRKGKPLLWLRKGRCCQRPLLLRKRRRWKKNLNS